MLTICKNALDLLSATNLKLHATKMETEWLRIEQLLSRSLTYAGTMIELMKGKGRETCGHIGIATDDIHGAKAYLEGLGCCFDPASSKHDADGNLIVRYHKDEIAGFAVHLLQRVERLDHDPTME